MHKVLLVDDSKLVHSFVSNICEDENFELFHAYGKKESQEVLAREKISLILLDIIMKDINGLDYCEELKESRFQDIPIIFLTGRTENESIVKGFQVGAVDYISKPFEKEELLARIHSQLRMLDMQQKLIQTEKLSSVNSMIATYNHELNNPLQIALMATNKLKSLLDTQQMEHADKLFSSLERIMSIVQKINEIQSTETENYGEGATMIKLNKD